ncbi:DUF1573 domain-containing protein [bacterium]|nr:DUF1573 domain-containing protein [candidate division CSSED10-310 bacterium]
MVSDKVIPPGGEGKVQIRFKTKNKHGKSSQKITVTSNDPTQPSLNLEVQAELEVYFDVSPRRLYFGRVKPGERITKTLTFTGKEIGSIRIRDIKIENRDALNYVQWKLHDDRTGETGIYTMDITLDPGKIKPGRFTENLIIVTDSKVVPDLTFNISGEILGPISATPPRIYFGNYEPGQSMARSVKIESSSGRPFRILSATINHDSLKASISDSSPKTVHMLEVVLDPDIKQDRFRAELIVKTDLAEHPEIEIPINGYKQRERTHTRTSEGGVGTMKSSADQSRADQTL